MQKRFFSFFFWNGIVLFQVREVMMEVEPQEEKTDVIPLEEENDASTLTKIDELLKEKLERVFLKQTSQVSLHDIAKIAIEHSPIDLAYAVSHLPPNARPILYDNLPSKEAKVDFLLNVDKNSRQTIFRYMNDQELVNLFERLCVDDAAWISEELSERRCRRILELSKPEFASAVRERKKHNRNSAGGLMTSEFFAFTMDMTIGEAAEFIRGCPRVDFSMGVYILSENEEVLGYVPARNLAINPRDLPLKQVMRPIFHKVLPEATREEVVEIVERYKLSILPVVDNEDHLLGVVAHEDVVEVMEDLADEMMGKMSGTGEKISSEDPLLARFMVRSPWLIFTLIAGLLNVVVMSFFQKREGAMLTFALFFVPLITGMSGNIGIQCSTVLVRSMALGTFGSRSTRESMVRELSIGIFTGFIFGVSCGCIIFLIDLLILGATIKGAIALGVIVGIGLIGACLTGTFLGVCSPIFFSRIGIDPAVSSGPIVTACNDVLSMTSYFLIAWVLGKLLLC